MLWLKCIGYGVHNHRPVLNVCSGLNVCSVINVCSVLWNQYINCQFVIIYCLSWLYSEPPKLEQGPESYLYPVSRVLGTSCKVTGNPPPKISWYHNGIPISETDIYSEVWYVGWTLSNFLSHLYPSLHLLLFSVSPYLSLLFFALSSCLCVCMVYSSAPYLNRLSVYTISYSIELCLHKLRMLKSSTSVNLNWKAVATWYLRFPFQ